MAEFYPAVQNTLKSEGGFFHNLETGEVVNHGITVSFLRSAGILRGSGPASPEEIFFVRNIDEDYATDLYRRYFWQPGGFAQLNSQKLANKCFDLAVNMGQFNATMLLQEALNGVTKGNHEVDGRLGPDTAHGCNSCDQDALYQALLVRAEARYRKIAQSDPRQDGELTGWLARLYKST